MQYYLTVTIPNLQTTIIGISADKYIHEGPPYADPFHGGDPNFVHRLSLPYCGWLLDTIYNWLRPKG